MEENRSYRIRTDVGGDNNVINVKLNQTYDTFEILSLKLDQKNSYKLYESDYGVVVGRVIANGGFGIPNAKVSVFIESEETDIEKTILYPFHTVNDTDNNLVRYNLIPDDSFKECHQNVGTFPNKRFLLDNEDVIEIFDKYWKYTTTTNKSGDYMLFGIPKGNQTIHVDIDLSDVGVLSQRPRDMIYKGYDINQFESPNKFKKDTNLDSLVQIQSQNIGVYVYPYWGDTSDDNDTIAISRCDIQIPYKFEPTCIFMGSIISDTGSNAISKSCGASKKLGKMSELTTGEGSIEMIRKTFDGKTEQLSIKGNRVIDGDGVWCYQIPMNLDYVVTDEFGNIVPTDNPSVGIPTRTRVRFRVSMDDSINDNTGRKRCRYLIPNNPRINNDYPVFSETKSPDYEFGSNTLDESYKDLLWNNVYTVKNYIPNLQKSESVNNGKNIGIKWINHYGKNNPMPYNGLTIKLTFIYKLLCVLSKVVIFTIAFLNTMLSIIMFPFCQLCRILTRICRVPVVGQLAKPLKKFFCKLVINCIKLSSDFCDDGINKYTYYPGCGPKPFSCIWDETKKEHFKDESGLSEENKTLPMNKPLLFRKYNENPLITCIENSLAQDNEVTSFNFSNDWINGVLYAPMWFRKITPKKKYFFGLIKKKAKDQWCSNDNTYGSLRLFKSCAVSHDPKLVVNKQCGNGCGKSTSSVMVKHGLVRTKETMLGQTVYYYTPVEYDKNRNRPVLLFATDIVLLGSLNKDNGIPQFFKSLESTTFKIPHDVLYTDSDVKTSQDDNGDINYTIDTDVEMTGCDWGNINREQECGSAKDGDSGLFYGIGCSKIEMKEKSCLNLSRICEFGVSLDEAKYVEDLNNVGSDELKFGLLIPDGFVSYDELYNLDERSMFATMNANNLRTKFNFENGLTNYDFDYMYTDNFDGSMLKLMKDRQIPCDDKYTYKHNYNLERRSDDYVRFRYGNVMGNFYDVAFKKFPYYENSFYFYFGLNGGKTAIEKFNSLFYSECNDDEAPSYTLNHEELGNSWCNDISFYNEYSRAFVNNRDGYIKIDLSGITVPYSLVLRNIKNDNFPLLKFKDIDQEKLYIGISKNIDKSVNIEKYSNLFEYIDNEESEIDQEFVQNYVLNNELSLDNGQYSIEILDEEDNGNELVIDFYYYYLSANNNANNFRFNNKALYDEFYEKNPGLSITEIYKLISSDREGWNGSKSADNLETEEIEFNNRRIGGMIVIYDLLYLGEQLKDNFKIEVEVEDAAKLPEYPDYSSYYQIFKGKETSSYNGTYFGKVDYQSRVIEYDTKNKPYAYYFGVPKGGVEYKVTITYLCDKDGDAIPDETLNVAVYRVFVNEPTKYRMLINGVDYELIKNFNTGWNSVEDDLFYPNKTVKRIIGWDDLSNIGGINKIGVSDYDIENRNWISNDEIEELVEKLIYSYDGYLFMGEALTDTMPQYINGRLQYYIAYNDNVFINFKDINNNVISVLGNQYPKLLIQEDTGTNDMRWRVEEKYTGKFNWGSSYNWPEEYRYKKSDLYNRYIGDLNHGNMTDDEILELYHEINNVIDRRLELVNNVKEAFYMTDIEEGKDVIISVRTDDYPIEYRLCYNSDCYNDCLEKDKNKLKGSKEKPKLDEDGQYILVCQEDSHYIIEDENFWFRTEENMVGNIHVPTLASKSFNNELNIESNDTEGESVPIKTGGNRNRSFEFGKTRVYGKYSDEYKKPYFISVKNSFDKILPANITLDEFKNDSFDYSFIKNNLFGFHIIQKEFHIDKISCAYVYRMPYFWPSGKFGIDEYTNMSESNEWKTYDNGGVNCYEIHAFDESNGLITYPKSHFKKGSKIRIKIHAYEVTNDAAQDVVKNIPSLRYYKIALKTTDGTENITVLPGNGDAERYTIPEQTFIAPFDIRGISVFFTGNASIYVQKTTTRIKFEAYEIRNSRDDGEFVTMNGCLQGTLYNGIPTNYIKDSVSGDIKTEFSTQIVDDKNIDIYTTSYMLSKQGKYSKEINIKNTDGKIYLLFPSFNVDHIPSGSDIEIELKSDYDIGTVNIIYNNNPNNILFLGVRVEKSTILKTKTTDDINSIELMPNSIYRSGRILGYIKTYNVLPMYIIQNIAENVYEISSGMNLDTHEQIKFKMVSSERGNVTLFANQDRRDVLIDNIILGKEYNITLNHPINSIQIVSDTAGKYYVSISSPIKVADDDADNTKRIITGFSDEKKSIVEYPYLNSGSGDSRDNIPINKDGNYISIGNKITSYIISDIKDNVYDTIYSSLRIKSNGIIDHRRKDPKVTESKILTNISIGCENGTANMTYYAFDYDMGNINTEYPLTDVYPDSSGKYSYRKSDNASYPYLYFHSTKEEFHNEFLRDVPTMLWSKAEYLKGKVFNALLLDSEATAEDKWEGMNSFIKLDSWSKDGKFEYYGRGDIEDKEWFGDDDSKHYPNRAFYVIGFTENGDRAFSPVYDLMKIDAKIVCKQKDDGKKIIGVSIRKITDSYYLSHYPSTVQLRVFDKRITKEDRIIISCDFTKKLIPNYKNDEEEFSMTNSEYLYTEISDEAYEYVQEIRKESDNDKNADVRLYFLVYVIDASGLKHLCDPILKDEEVKKDAAK